MLLLQLSPNSESLFQKAVAIDPTSAEAYLNLGKLASHRRDDSAAVGYLERAVTLQPDSSAALYELGLTYRKTGQPAKAAAALKRFRELKTSSQ